MGSTCAAAQAARVCPLQPDTGPTFTHSVRRRTIEQRHPSSPCTRFYQSTQRALSHSPDAPPCCHAGIPTLVQPRFLSRGADLGPSRPACIMTLCAAFNVWREVRTSVNMGASWRRGCQVADDVDSKMRPDPHHSRRKDVPGVTSSHGWGMLGRVQHPVSAPPNPVNRHRVVSQRTNAQQIRMLGNC